MNPPDASARYRTIGQEAAAEIVVEKSRFIAAVARAADEADAAAFIAAVRKRHWHAAHNCSAFRVGLAVEMQRSSDDGEPAGTAGKPILECLHRLGLRNTVAVVTRYFGGVKLGAGGLVRAYGAAALAGIRAAGIVERVRLLAMKVCCDYAEWHRLERELRRLGHLQAPAFSETVTAHVLVEPGAVDALRRTVADLTGGRVSPHEAGFEFVEKSIEAVETEEE
jgi:uncharacterized YigZ family protein